MKTVVTVAWMLLVILFTWLAGLSSTVSWLAAAAMAVIPPAIMWQLWSPPVMTLSESIRTVRDDS